MVQCGPNTRIGEFGSRNKSLRIQSRPPVVIRAQWPALRLHSRRTRTPAHCTSTFRNRKLFDMGTRIPTCPRYKGQRWIPWWNRSGSDRQTFDATMEKMQSMHPNVDRQLHSTSCSRIIPDRGLENYVGKHNLKCAGNWIERKKFCLP